MFPPGPAGVAFKINSIFKSEERYRRREKRGEKKSRQLKERGERGQEEKTEPVQRERARERECISFHVL